MEKFISEYDPLVALEADYAAVVARTRSNDTKMDPANDEDVSTEIADKNDPEPAESDDDEDDDYASNAALYAPLHGDSDDEDDSDDEQDEEQDANNQEPVIAAVEGTAAPPTPMDETTKHAIMAAMQSMTLPPPPWARDAAIPDDELVELVQQRLRNRTPQ